MGDFALLGSEVVLDFVGVIVFASLREDGIAVHVAVGVSDPASVEFVICEINLNVVGTELHVLVLHHGVAKEKGHPPLQVVDYRVARTVFHHRGDGVLGDDLRRLGKIDGAVRKTGVGDAAYGAVGGYASGAS